VGELVTDLFLERDSFMDPHPFRADRLREAEALREAHIGDRVGVYIPFGSAWYPYLMRRMAERPANLLFFLRSAVGR
jgi:proline dehydrogenase